MRHAPFRLVNLAGMAAFAWPVVLGTSGDGGAHAADAPLLVALLVPLLVVVAVAEARDRTGDARPVALLGALVAVNAFLRIPKGPSGEGFVFVLPILCGWVFGPRFGFLLGSFSMLASAVLTGGVGPWLPFQMFALGWVGAGAGLLRRLVGGRVPVVSLTAYAFAASIAYGVVINLWFWPFLATGAGDVRFVAGAGLAETAVRYGRFYLLTSLPWDMGRALLTNVPLVAILARPVGTLLERARERFVPEVEIVRDTERASRSSGDTGGAMASEEEKRKMRRLAEDLEEIETNEIPDAESWRAVLAWANEKRAEIGMPPFPIEDSREEDPPELEFYRRAKALGMGRYGKQDRRRSH